MIKKIITFSIPFILIIATLTGCNNKNESTKPNNNDESSVVIESETVTEAEPKAQEKAEQAGAESEAETEPASEPFVSEEVSVSDYNELPDDIKGTIIPIDSLLLYHVETGNPYDANSSHMLWRSLQYAFGNFGAFYNRAELNGSAFCVEPMTVGEFTTAILDGDYQNFAIPDELSDSVWYDSENDRYCFAAGDRGLSQTEILAYQYLEDHNLKITARLYAQDDNSTICNGTFYLKRNEYASGVIEPLFYFTVTDAEFTMP